MLRRWSMIARISRVALAGILFVALGGVFQATGAQTPEENKTLVRRLFEEIMNQGSLDVADEILATDYIEHFPPNPDIPGLDAVKQFILGIRTGFPDVQFTIDDMMAEGDKVAIRATFRGTHLGEFQGIPATGVSVTLTAIDIWRVAEGKLQEGWVHADMLGMLQQLGVIPPVPGALPALERGGDDFLWGEPSEVIGDPGDPETNKAIVRRETEEIWNQGDLDLIDEMYATNLVNHDPTWPGVRDFETYAEWVATLGRPPGLYITIEDMIGEGDKVAARWTGTFTEPTSGVQATLTGTILYRFADGKIVEMWWAKDFLGLVQQLPSPEVAVESRTWGQVKSLFQE